MLERRVVWGRRREPEGEGSPALCPLKTVLW